MSFLKKWSYALLILLAFSVSTGTFLHAHEASELHSHACSLCQFSAQSDQLSDPFQPFKLKNETTPEAVFSVDVQSLSFCATYSPSPRAPPIFS